MISFMLLKWCVKEAWDLEDLVLHMLFFLPTIILDTIFILFQPLFIVIYIMWKRRR